MTDGCVCVHYYITSAGNSFSSQLLSQGDRYSTEKAGCAECSLSITYEITPAGSLSSSQPGGPPSWARILAFGLIDRPSLTFLPCNLQCRTNMRNSKSIERWWCRTGYLSTSYFKAWLVIVYSILACSVPQSTDPNPPLSAAKAGRNNLIECNTPPSSPLG
jgi:hypothetical protein